MLYNDIFPTEFAARRPVNFKSCFFAHNFALNPCHLFNFFESAIQDINREKFVIVAINRFGKTTQFGKCQP